MAIVTNLTVTGTRQIDIPGGISNASMISLSQGGVAAVANGTGGGAKGVILDADGNQKATFNIAGEKASIAQLTNGNLVVASLVDGRIDTDIIDSSTGAYITGPSPSEYLASNISVTANSWGFYWVVSESEGYRNVDLDIYFEDGRFYATKKLSTFDADFHSARAVQREGALVAVVVAVDDLDSTEVWIKMYTVVGNAYIQFKILDQNARSNLQITAVATTSGFAIAYEVEVDGETDIKVVALDWWGNVLHEVILDVPGNQTKPSLTALPGGRLLLSYDNNINPDTDTEFVILSQNLTTEFNFPISGAFPEHDQESSVVASMGNGNFAIMHEDRTAGSISGELVYTAIEHTSDEESDLITGDNSYSNIMHGNEGNDSLVGGQQNDLLYGGIGNDMLSGGAGEDSMDGGLGNDTFYVNSAQDSAHELADGGTHDRIYTSVNYVLADNEYIEFINANSGSTGIAITGNNVSNNIAGGAGYDTLNGGAGNDTLSGKGGIDRLTGGTGNDTYYVEEAVDMVHEGSTEGTLDRLYASANYTLADNEYIEYLYVHSASGISLNGNNLANRLFGNAQNDTLGGGGGNDIIDGKAGADDMSGGNGNDTFYVDNVNDRVRESSTGGSIDRVYSRVNYTLAAGEYVEALYASGATAGMNLAGNDLGNQVYGSAFGDTLSGGGGIDRLMGYAGNDTLLGGDGVDTIYGGANNDRIVGGTGIDSLYGEAGSDIFVLTRDAADYDNIRDFVSGADKLEISASLFGGGLSVGTLTGLQFIANGSGLANDGGSDKTRFIYNLSNGQLFYDEDGTGAGARVRIANLVGTPVPTLAIADFTVV